MDLTLFLTKSWLLFWTAAYSISFHSACVALRDQKGKFLFICCLYGSECAAEWWVVLHPENIKIRELQICHVSILGFPTPVLAEKSALKNTNISKQLLIRMLGWILTFSELRVNVKMGILFQETSNCFSFCGHLGLPRSAGFLRFLGLQDLILIPYLCLSWIYGSWKNKSWQGEKCLFSRQQCH